MKLILARIGKSWNAIKREGIFRGGKRISVSFFRLFKRVGSGDILFITGGVGDSARYRTHNVAEELSLKGFQCSTTVQDNPFLIKYVDKFKIFVFHRTIYTERIGKFIKELKHLEREIIFDTDDLVFDAKYFKQMDYQENINQLEKKVYEGGGIGKEIIEDPYVKVCTTTTAYLAEELKKYNKQVFIVPNRLDQKEVEWADKILQKKEEKKDDKIRLGYFSGTISHNKDFATITKALMQVMEKHGNVELFLVGPLDLENKLIAKYQDRIVQLPFVPRKEHYENISKVDINLSPLEKDNPFCIAKSELKFFEAGILKVPTMAVDNQTLRGAVDDGVDGFLAASTEEWVEKLERLINDGELRKSMGEKAREKTLQKYATQNANNEEYYNYLRDRIKQISD